MKPRHWIAAFAFFAIAVSMRTAVAIDSTSITLPSPRLDGEVSIEEALHDRRSFRDPASTPLTLGEVGQLCWAAQGVTDDKGHRTTPSAMALYPLEIYVLAGSVTDLPAGLYHYEPVYHSLRLVAEGDMRATMVDSAIGQNWIKQAPALFVITGVAARMARMGERGLRFMDIEAGLAAQGFFLQAAAMGLGSTYVGGFDPTALRAVLALPETEDALAVLPVGRRQ